MRPAIAARTYSIGRGLADPGRVVVDEVALELLDLLVGQDDLGELADPGVDAVHDLVGGDLLLEHRAAGADPLERLRGELHRLAVRGRSGRAVRSSATSRRGRRAQAALRGPTPLRPTRRQGKGTVGAPSMVTKPTLRGGPPPGDVPGGPLPTSEMPSRDQRPAPTPAAGAASTTRQRRALSCDGPKRRPGRRPPGRWKGAAQTLQRGGDGTWRQKRRSFSTPRSSPLSGRPPVLRSPPAVVRLTRMVRRALGSLPPRRQPARRHVVTVSAQNIRRSPGTRLRTRALTASDPTSVTTTRIVDLRDRRDGESRRGGTPAGTGSAGGRSRCRTIAGQRPPGRPGPVDPAPEERDAGDDGGQAEGAEERVSTACAATSRPGRPSARRGRRRRPGRSPRPTARAPVGSRSREPAVPIRVDPRA